MIKLNYKLQQATWGFFMAFLLVLSLAACRSEEQTEAQRQAYVMAQAEAKIAEFRHDVLKQCYEKALTKASLLADSILILEARFELDTTGRPPKPLKPEKPTIKSLSDSTGIKPLFN